MNIILRLLTLSLFIFTACPINAIADPNSAADSVQEETPAPNPDTWPKKIRNHADRHKIKYLLGALVVFVSATAYFGYKSYTLSNKSVSNKSAEIEEAKQVFEACKINLKGLEQISHNIEQISHNNEQISHNNDVIVSSFQKKIEDLEKEKKELEEKHKDCNSQIQVLKKENNELKDKVAEQKKLEPEKGKLPALIDLHTSKYHPAAKEALEKRFPSREFSFDNTLEVTEEFKGHFTFLVNFLYSD
jgi:DNA repair exonuclease SbcCD ATPase subunit